MQDRDQEQKAPHRLKNTACLEQKWRRMKSIIVTAATMIANIHIMSNKLRPMYNVKLKQHAGKTTEPFYKTICCRVVLSNTRERGNVGCVCVYMCVCVCVMF